MKQCPVCKTTYTDDSIAFCLEDGTNLQSITVTSGSFPTEQVSYGANPVRVNIPSEPTVVVPQPLINSASSEKSKGWLIGIIALGLIGILFAGIAGLIYFTRNGGNTASNVSVNSNAVAISNKSDSGNTESVVDNTASALETNKTTGDREATKLKEKLAKLEREIAEQKKKTAASNSLSTSAPAGEHPSIKIATVYSPNDGYLALRTAPSSSTGSQILKIPHGDTVTVGNCLTVKKADGKSGRWCRVVYDGQEGWAFDGFLRY